MQEAQHVIGGQAVLEGVMMRCGNHVAVAVRRPDGSIHVERERRRSWADRWRWLAWPVLRGSSMLFESTLVGYHSLNRSANVTGDTEDEMTRGQVAMTMILSTLLSLGVFILLPLFAAEWIIGRDGHTALFAAVEGVLRLGLFLGYIWLISRMDDIRRVFQYHGAEHKTINCYEAGEPLTVENVRRHTLIHKRCGTSFLLFVVLIASVLFSGLSAMELAMWQMVLFRLLAVPLAAGLSYEVIRWSGGSDHPIVNLFAAPGMRLQRLTTREPDDGMIEVAITSVHKLLEMFPVREQSA